MNGYEFKVIGLAAWEGFENIEISYLHNLQVHLIVSENLDATTWKAQQFITDFGAAYESKPEKFSYLGYDVGTYYLSLLNEHGSNFRLMLPQYVKNGLGRKFHYYKTGFESGFENHSVYLIKFEDFQKVRVY
jgi:hypothetical protein